MDEEEIRLRIEAVATNESGDTEYDHVAYDELVTDVLKYIAAGGANADLIAKELLRKEPPTEWGWYA